MTLKGRTIFMSGGSRGIGLAIATACAAEGANVTIAAKIANTARLVFLFTWSLAESSDRPPAPRR